MEEQKISFWKKISIAIKNIEQYQILAGERPKKAISYLLKLMLIFSVIISLAITIKFTSIIQEFKTFVEQDLAEITFKDNILNIKAKDNEKTVITRKVESISTKVIVDTNEITEEKIQEYTNNIKQEFNGIILLKDKVIIKNEMTNLPSTYNYFDIASKYNIGSFEKQDVINKLSSQTLLYIISIFFIIMCIYLYIIYFSSVLLDALVLAILGYITSSILKIKLKVSALYNIAIYALTLPIILNVIYIVVNMFTGFTVKYFQVMYTAISYIYVVSSILIIKSDIVKRHIELTKIMQEQEKVKEEIEKKEREKKEEEEKERIKKKDEEKRKEEKGNTSKKGKTKKGLDSEGQPEGTNA